MNCDFHKCDNNAAWIVNFEFRATHNSEPVVHKTDIHVCEKCRSILTPDMIINARAFHIASDAIIKSGRLPPDRALTTIQWEKITC